MGTLIYLPESPWDITTVSWRNGMGCAWMKSALNRAFRSVWKQMPPRESTKKQRPDDDKGWWRILVGRVLEISIAENHDFDLDACFEELYLHFAQPGVWQLYPEADDVLANPRRIAPAGRYFKFRPPSPHDF